MATRYFMTYEAIRQEEARLQERVRSYPVNGRKTSTEVTYKPLSEYVGDRFEAFLTERRYDYDGKVARYDSERKLTAANLLTGQYLEKELGAKVERLIANAKKEVEESLISSLEQKLKENLAKDTIEKMNIPEVLKRFTEMSLEQKQ